jgi:L-threonylcarbamoyladenylate synthase
MPPLILGTASTYVEQALRILAAGGLVAFPTDTVYGVGALAFDSAAVERLYWAKDRPTDRAIPILLGRAGDMASVADEVPDMALTLAERYWPGPLTLVVRKAPGVPESVTKGATVGIRVPNHAVALNLLQAAGPMAVTSANLSGRAPARTADEVLAQLEAKLDLIVDGGTTPGGIASTVVDCTGDVPRILRRGPIALDEIESALR